MNSLTVIKIVFNLSFAEADLYYTFCKHFDELDIPSWKLIHYHRSNIFSVVSVSYD